MFCTGRTVYRLYLDDFVFKIKKLLFAIVHSRDRGIPKQQSRMNRRSTRGDANIFVYYGAVFLVDCLLPVSVFFLFLPSKRCTELCVNPIDSAIKYAQKTRQYMKKQELISSVVLNIGTTMVRYYYIVVNTAIFPHGTHIRYIFGLVGWR